MKEYSSSSNSSSNIPTACLLFALGRSVHASSVSVIQCIGGLNSRRIKSTKCFSTKPSPPPPLFFLFSFLLYLDGQNLF